MSLKTKLKARKPEYLDLVFCLDRPLMKDLEKARREHESESAGRMAAPKSKTVKDLEKAVADASVTIRVASLPWEAYNALMLEHPAREGHDEQFDASTFYAAAAKATAEEVTAKSTVPIPEEDWDEFMSGLTDGEYDRLAGAVVAVNRNTGTVNIAPLA